MERKVEFIGSGHEVVRSVMVDTPTMAEAYEAAEQWYKETNQNFHYCEMEIPKEYAFNESFVMESSVDGLIAEAEGQKNGATSRDGGGVKDAPER